MSKLMKEAILTCILTLFITGHADCTRPVEDVNPNGFPSGDHFNLIIAAKQSDFSCPGVLYDEYGYPIYDNVIYIPEHPQHDVRIVMEPGEKGLKSAPDIIGLRVTDTCTGFAPDDPATLLLPKNRNGYRVYAQVLGKPSDGKDSLRVMEIYDPEFTLVQDEFGNDLMYLGLVTERGYLTTSASFVRTSDKLRAVDITGLFLWSGSICYPSPPDEFSLPDSCCLDQDGDGIYDRCSPLTEDAVCEGAPVYCTEYLNEWVFNIGDFVEYFWNIDNNGTKLLQIRFYPL